MVREASIRFLRILLQTLSVTLAFCVLIQAPARGQTDESTKPERKTQAKKPAREQDAPVPAPKFMIKPLDDGGFRFTLDPESAEGKRVIDRLRRRGVTDIPETVNVVVYPPPLTPCSIPLKRLPVQAEEPVRPDHPPEQDPKIRKLPMIAPPCDE